VSKLFYEFLFPEERGKAMKNRESGFDLSTLKKLESKGGEKMRGVKSDEYHKGAGPDCIGYGKSYGLCPRNVL
jgi:hypothetical protein